jgi:hypothetical protein
MNRPRTWVTAAALAGVAWLAVTVENEIRHARSVDDRVQIKTALRTEAEVLHAENEQSKRERAENREAIRRLAEEVGRLMGRLEALERR